MNQDKIEKNLNLVLQFLKNQRIGSDVNRPITPVETEIAIKLLEEAIEELYK